MNRRNVSEESFFTFVRYDLKVFMVSISEIVDLQLIFNAILLVCLTYHCTLFEVPDSSGSFAVTIKPIVIEIFHMVDVYLFYITKWIYVMLIHSEHLFIVIASSNCVMEPLPF